MRQNAIHMNQQSSTNQIWLNSSELFQLVPIGSFNTFLLLSTKANDSKILIWVVWSPETDLKDRLVKTT